MSNERLITMLEDTQTGVLCTFLDNHVNESTYSP
jgi:hypothetical protein